MWLKITGFLGLIIGGLLTILKFKNNKIEDLEEENEIMGEVVQITNEMKQAKKEAAGVAQNEKDNIDDSDWRDSI